MKISISFLLLATQLASALAQEPDIEKDARHNWPLSIAFSMHSFSWPFHKSISSPIQPGLRIGTEYNYYDKNKHAFLQTFNGGYFRHPEFLEAINLNSYFAYRFSPIQKLSFDAKLGLGYMHRRHVREVFILEGGEYESRKDLGRPGIMLGFNLGLAYNFRLAERKGSFFVEYDWFGNMPHVKEEVPSMANSLYHIGFRYHLKKR